MVSEENIYEEIGKITESDKGKEFLYDSLTRLLLNFGKKPGVFEKFFNGYSREVIREYITKSRQIAIDIRQDGEYIGKIVRILTVTHYTGMKLLKMIVEGCNLVYFYNAPWAWNTWFSEINQLLGIIDNWKSCKEIEMLSSKKM